MAISSLFVLAFLVVHLLQFRFGPWCPNPTPNPTSNPTSSTPNAEPKSRYDYLSKIDVTVISEMGLETVPKVTPNTNPNPNPNPQS